VTILPVSDAVEAIMLRARATSDGLDAVTVQALDELDVPGDDQLLELAAYAKGEAAEAQAVGQVIHDLTVRKSGHTRRVEAIHAYILERFGGARIRDGRSVIRTQHNPPKVVIDDCDALPRECMRHIPEKLEPDKKEISARLKTGALVPGAHLKQTARLVIE